MFCEWGCMANMNNFGASYHFIEEEEDALMLGPYIPESPYVQAAALCAIFLAGMVSAAYAIRRARRTTNAPQAQLV